MLRRVENLRHSTADPVVRAAAMAYYGLDPRHGVTEVAPTLERVRDSMDDTPVQPQHRLLLASAITELALRPRETPKRRSRAIRAARRLLLPFDEWTDGSIGKDVDVDTAVGARRLNETGRIISDSSKSTRVEAARMNAHLLEQLIAASTNDSLKREQREGSLGQAFRQSVLCLLSGPEAAERGLAAYGAFERQDTNVTYVPEGRYQWSVTVESDGTDLPVGEYRVQPTLGLAGNGMKLHPDLAVVSAVVHLGDNPYMNERLAVGRAILDGTDCAVEQGLNNVVHVLEQTGPVASARIVFPNAA